MNYILDTNVILTYIRQSKYSLLIDEKYAPLSAENTPIISVVSVGELYAIALKNKWGITKIDLLKRFINMFIIADINVSSILQTYAKIDAFSQGKLVRDNKFTARNMGKNDLWIAATAATLNAVLLTTDKDFDHLQETFIRLSRVVIEEKPK